MVAVYEMLSRYRSRVTMVTCTKKGWKQQGKKRCTRQADLAKQVLNTFYVEIYSEFDVLLLFPMKQGSWYEMLD